MIENAQAEGEIYRYFFDDDLLPLGLENEFRTRINSPNVMSVTSSSRKMIVLEGRVRHRDIRCRIELNAKNHRRKPIVFSHGLDVSRNDQ